MVSYSYAAEMTILFNSADYYDKKFTMMIMMMMIMMMIMKNYFDIIMILIQI